MCLQPENEEKSVVYDNIGPNVCMGDHKVTTGAVSSSSLCVIVLWRCGWSGEEPGAREDLLSNTSSGKTGADRCSRGYNMWITTVAFTRKFTEAENGLVSVALWS